MFVVIQFHKELILEGSHFFIGDIMIGKGFKAGYCVCLNFLDAKVVVI